MVLMKNRVVPDRVQFPGSLLNLAPSDEVTLDAAHNTVISHGRWYAVSRCSERFRSQSRTTSSCSLRHYRYWQCDRVCFCLCDRVPLLCFGVGVTRHADHLAQILRAQVTFSQVHGEMQVTIEHSSGRTTLLQVARGLHRCTVTLSCCMMRAIHQTEACQGPCTLFGAFMSRELTGRVIMVWSS